MSKAVTGNEDNELKSSYCVSEAFNLTVCTELHLDPRPYGSNE